MALQIVEEEGGGGMVAEEERYFQEAEAARATRFPRPPSSQTSKEDSRETVRSSSPSLLARPATSSSTLRVTHVLLERFPLPQIRCRTVSIVQLAAMEIALEECLVRFVLLEKPIPILEALPLRLAQIVLHTHTRHKARLLVHLLAQVALITVPVPFVHFVSQANTLERAAFQ